MNNDPILVPAGSGVSKRPNTPTDDPILIPKNTKVGSGNFGGEIKEITEQTQIPWNERLGTDFKLMATSEPWEKARIIARSFPERVEILRDEKSGSPVVTIDGQPYWVNKEGASAQDLNDLVAETGSYVLPSLLSGGLGILGRFGVGALSYGAAETGREAATSAFGGKESGDPLIDGGDVATAATTGAVTEAFLPPIFKVAGRGFRKIWGGKKLDLNTLDAIITAAANGKSDDLAQAIRASQKSIDATPDDIPLTRGQRTGNVADIEREAMMRESTGAYGEKANKIVTDFDEEQLGAITDKAETLQSDIGAGSGFAPEVPAQVGQRISDDVANAERATYTAADNAQEAAKSALKDSPAYFPKDAAISGLDNALNVPREMGIGAFEFNSMASLKQTQQRLLRLKKNLTSGKLDRAAYSSLHSLRKRLKTQVDNVGARTPEGVALIRMRQALDDAAMDAVTKGLVEGDEATILMAKNADTMWRDYKTMFFEQTGRGSNDLAGRAIEKLQKEQSPEKVFNMLVSISKAGPSGQNLKLVDRMIDIFGKDSDQMRLVKDAAIYRMFTKSNLQGKSGVSRKRILDNYVEFFQKNSSLANRIFTSEEKDAIRVFVGQVAKTIPAETVMNPSGTGKFLLRALRDVSQGGLLASIVAKSPVGNPGSITGAATARSHTYLQNLQTQPLGALVTAINNDSFDAGPALDTTEKVIRDAIK